MVDPAVLKGLLISKMLGPVREISRNDGHLASPEETTYKPGLALINGNNTRPVHVRTKNAQRQTLF